jgi:multidrug efflux pump subunit AcrA (membrane-fusion protein)
MMTWGKRLLGWVGVLLVLAGAWWFLFRAPAKGDEKKTVKAITAVPVTVQPVVGRPVERFAAVVGTLQGIDEMTLTPKVEGRVRAILHDINDVLAPDTPLLVLDDVDHRLAESEAQRTLELELAKVALTVDRLPAKGKDEDAVVVNLPMVVRARNLEENASRKLQRTLMLGTNIPAEELDQVRTDLRVAQANHQQQVIECRSAIASAREKLAKLQSAQQRLRDTTLRVPAPSPERLAEIARCRGVSSVSADEVRYRVAQRMTSEGELVKASTTGVFKLVLDQPLKLVVTVPERYLAEVAVGQPVQVTVEAYPEDSFTGEVLRVNPTVDRANRTFQVEVNIPNEDRKLRSGMFAKASIRTRKDDRALLVPEEALVSFAGVNKVFVVRGDKALGVPVRLGERLETTSEDGRRLGWLEVKGAVQVGEPVVTSGQMALADGTPVRIRDEKGGK